MQRIQLWDIRYPKKVDCFLEVLSKERIELGIYILTSGQILKSKPGRNSADQSRVENRYMRLSKLDHVHHVIKKSEANNCETSNCN